MNKTPVIPPALAAKLATMTSEEKSVLIDRLEFAANPALQKEFGTLTSYLRLRRAERDGRARIFVPHRPISVANPAGNR